MICLLKYLTTVSLYCLYVYLDAFLEHAFVDFFVDVMLFSVKEPMMFLQAWVHILELLMQFKLVCLM